MMSVTGMFRRERSDQRAYWRMPQSGATALARFRSTRRCSRAPLGSARAADLSAGGAPALARSFPRAQALAALTGAIVEETDFGCGPLTASPSRLFVAGLGPQGDAFCSVSFAPSEYEGLSRIALDPAGAPVTVGTLKGTIDLDPRADPCFTPPARAP
ncbi:hypothetical protein WMF04_29385 [Sorangium sp. So ce260]|uniref:hypothetical protein n=1 Tax=Sorangium sp. So ce260 TaxID=3133291 RepID=UPI003F5D7D24